MLQLIGMSQRAGCPNRQRLAGRRTAQSITLSPAATAASRKTAGVPGERAEAAQLFERVGPQHELANVHRQ